MRTPYYGKARHYTKYDANDAFEVVKVYIPKGTHQLLKEASEDLETPMSRLMAIALDNELDADVPFNYPCPMPDAPYVEYAYANEAGKIMRFLEHFPTGTSVDTLMLCRRDIGIESRAVFMLAYRELLEKNMIEDFKPTNTKFKYGPDYKRVRAVGVEPKELRKKKFKRIEGESTRNQRVITDDQIDRGEKDGE